MHFGFEHFYLRQEGRVLPSVCPFVCLVNQKVFDEFLWKFWRGVMSNSGLEFGGEPAPVTLGLRIGLQLPWRFAHPECRLCSWNRNWNDPGNRDVTDAVEWETTRRAVPMCLTASDYRRYQRADCYLAGRCPNNAVAVTSSYSTASNDRSTEVRRQAAARCLLSDSCPCGSARAPRLVWLFYQ